MPDGNSSELNVPIKESLWKKINRKILRRRPAVPSQPTIAPISTVIKESKPTTTPSGINPERVPNKAEPSTQEVLESLQEWWQRNRDPRSQEELFNPYTNPPFFTSDSELPPDLPDHSHITPFLRERGLIGFSTGNEMTLPLDTKTLKKILPPYLKISPIDIDKSHRVFLVNPSSKFLELTEYRDGKFLFRGEYTESSHNAVGLIAKRFEDRLMTTRKRGDGLHTTPTPSVASRQYSYSYGGDGKENGIVWIIDRKAMDNHPISIKNGGIEIVFPEISLEYLKGCVVSGKVAKELQGKVELPSNFLYTLPSDVDPRNYDNLDEYLMNIIKALEANLA